MPTYTFKCLTCGEIVEIEHTFREPHPTRHEEPVAVFVIEKRGDAQAVSASKERPCGGVLQRVFLPTNVVYKGSGFFTTDKVLYDPDPDDSD